MEENRSIINYMNTCIIENNDKFVEKVIKVS